MHSLEPEYLELLVDGEIDAAAAIRTRSRGETRSLGGDYLLLLGALTLSADVGYAESQFAAECLRIERRRTMNCRISCSWPVPAGSRHKRHRSPWPHSRAAARAERTEP
jgi:hypothetical protein